MKYCQRCVMPISAVASSFNEKQICSACEYHDVYESLSTEQWLDRKKFLKKYLMKINLIQITIVLFQ